MASCAFGWSWAAKLSLTIGRVVGPIPKWAASLARKYGSTPGLSATVCTRKSLNTAPKSPAVHAPSLDIVFLPSPAADPFTMSCDGARRSIGPPRRLLVPVAVPGGGVASAR